MITHFFFHAKEGGTERNGGGACIFDAEKCGYYKFNITNICSCDLIV